MLTIRNWMIGYYIVEFEQNGEDRAKYGSGLLNKLSKKISIQGLTSPELSRCRQFYKIYPQILGTVSQEFNHYLPESILGTVSQESNLQPNYQKKLSISPENIVAKLSFSHIVELIKIEDDLKRSFYEIETIKGSLSVRETRRQINSLYFERSGLSKKPEKLAKLVQQKTKPQAGADIIKNIYAFEFLDLPVKEIIEESDLETALLDNLQQFIVELGYGFCFEARQKRILIGEKDHALVKYATAGMDKNLFVQKYMLKLPDAKILQQHIEKELKLM